MVQLACQIHFEINTILPIVEGKQMLQFLGALGMAKSRMDVEDQLKLD